MVSSWLSKMNSLIDRANSTSYFGVAERKSHWEYNWYVSSRPETTSNESHTHGNAEAGRPNEVDGKSSLKFKSWLSSDMPVFGGLPDIEKSDLFDLSKYNTSNNGNANNSNHGQASSAGGAADSLTEADIRGAVGNTDSITLSSTAAHANASQQDQPSPADAKKEEESQTEPNGQAEHDKPQKTDAEGDVNME